jgi:hypothetical protein
VQPVHTGGLPVQLEQVHAGPVCVHIFVSLGARVFVRVCASNNKCTHADSVSAYDNLCIGMRVQLG